MKLYYHKTDGGAEYLYDTFVVCPNGHKEGAIDGASFIVRIDGNIEQDAELQSPLVRDLLMSLSALYAHADEPDSDAFVLARELARLVIDRAERALHETE